MGHAALLLQLGAGHGRGLQVSMRAGRVAWILRPATAQRYTCLLACTAALSPGCGLPGCCCPSPPRAPRLYAKPLAGAFEKRADLRVTICHALRRLCTQNRATLAAAGQPVGHADPCAVMSGGGGDDEGLAASQEEQVGGVHGGGPACSQERCPACSRGVEPAWGSGRRSVKLARDPSAPSPPRPPRRRTWTCPTATRQRWRASERRRWGARERRAALLPHASLHCMPLLQLPAPPCCALPSCRWQPLPIMPQEPG